MIVVIPIHNQVRNIDLVLQAYLNQTKIPAHLIMVFDRCTDGSYDLACTYRSRFKKAGCWLHLVDATNSPVKGFGAGRTRDVGIQYAMSQRLAGSFLFSDGDCVPSPELVAHHAEILNTQNPRITCGLRYETVPSGQSPEFPIIPNIVVGGMPVQDDLRLNAEWCRNLVFGNGYDRLVINPQVFEKSWICWSCNLGMNQAAINVCQRANGILDGDESRVFNSSFDGRWGGEDGFVGLTMFRTGNEVIALYGRSYVTHLWHPRNHTNQEHLILVAEKDRLLKEYCSDNTIPADATILTGLLHPPTADALDIGYLETTDVIKPGTLLSKVIDLYREDFIYETLALLFSGAIKYSGAVPTRKYTGDRDVLGRKCAWAKGTLPWLQVELYEGEFSVAVPVIAQDETKQ